MTTFNVGVLGYCIGVVSTVLLTEYAGIPPSYVKWLFGGYSVIMLVVILYRPVAEMTHRKNA